MSGYSISMPEVKNPLGGDQEVEMQDMQTSPPLPSDGKVHREESTLGDQPRSTQSMAEGLTLQVNGVYGKKPVEI